MKEIEKLKKELEATRQSLGKVIQDVEKIKFFLRLRSRRT